MLEETFDLFCPKCNILVEMRPIAQGLGHYESDVLNPLDDADALYHGEVYSILTCRRCNHPFLVRDFRSRGWRDENERISGTVSETITDRVTLYPPSPGLKFEGLPGSLATSLDQAHRSFGTHCYVACALMCRRALEAVCNTLLTKRGTLAARLKHLLATGHIDQRLFEWTHMVRLVGNEAAHDVETDVSRDDARDMLELTEALVMYVFTLDRMFRAFEERRKMRSSASDEEPA